MRSTATIFQVIGLCATLSLALPGVAMAGQKDRALQAIAEARGRISAGNMVGASQEALGLQTQAKSMLNDAEGLLSRGKKTEAIAAAQQAGQFADQAIAMTSSNKSNAADAAVGRAENAAANAQQAAADANRNAADASARADLAMTTPPVAPSTTTTVAVTAPTTTTAVTTEVAAAAPVASVPVKRRTTVRAHSHRGKARATVRKAPAVTTGGTTTVTTVSH